MKGELTQPNQQPNPKKRVLSARSALRAEEPIDKAAFVELAHEARVD
jgi:hypothetical protein